MQFCVKFLKKINYERDLKRFKYKLALYKKDNLKGGLKNGRHVYN